MASYKEILSLIAANEKSGQFPREEKRPRATATHALTHAGASNGQ